MALALGTAQIPTGVRWQLTSNGLLSPSWVRRCWCWRGATGTGLAARRVWARPQHNVADRFWAVSKATIRSFEKGLSYVWYGSMSKPDLGYRIFDAATGFWNGEAGRWVSLPAMR